MKARRMNQAARGWLLGLLAMVCAPALGGLVPPQDGLVPDRAAEAIVEQLKAGRMGDAVERVQTLLADESAKLIKQDSRLLPVTTWVDLQLASTNTRDAFIAEYEKSLGAIARRDLEVGRRSGSLVEVMRMAARYPWTLASMNAPLDAVKLALDTGDISTAAALDPTAKQIDGIPQDRVLPSASFSSEWYQAFLPVLTGRIVPVAATDFVVVASPVSVVAMNGQGRLLWSTGPAPASKPLLAASDKRQAVEYTDESLSRPVVWCDLGGTPRVVAARYTDGGGSSLRAYRASDGKQVWDTAALSDSKDWVVIGSPATSGGMVFSIVAKLDAASGARLMIVAFDLAGGNVLWKSEIGEMAPATHHRGAKRDDRFRGASVVLDRFDGTSAVLSVDRRSVYAVMTGWCVAVDRFSGQVRWLASYPLNVMDEKQMAREKKQKVPSLFRRWRDEAVSDGTTVVVAPTDSDAVVAFDAATGVQQWKSDGLRGHEMIGLSGDRVLFAGASISALKISTGESIWQNALPDTRFTGPCVIDRDFLGVITDRGPAYFSIERGLTAQRRDPGVVSLDALLRQPVTRNALQTADLLRYFQPGTPTGSKTERQK